MQCIKIISVVIIFVLSKSVMANEAAEQLANTFKQLDTIQADFTQQTLANGEVIQNSSGYMKIARPNKFRWYVQELIEQLIVSDGTNVWIYDVDLEQVSIKNLQEVGKTPIMLLSGQVNEILADYYVTMMSSGERVTYQLKATNETANFAGVELTFNDLTLLDMRLSDYLDQVTDLTFSNVVINQPIDENQFQFTPPEGVDVIGEVSE